VSAVVPVMNPTSVYHDGAGMTNAHPMINATSNETHGMPHRFGRWNARGTFPDTDIP
jgi:hypothetical protein